MAYLSLGKEVWDYRYNIGYWAWELETFPEEWLPAFKLVDEKAYRNALDKYTPERLGGMVRDFINSQMDNR